MSSTERPRVAVLGTGVMGFAMAGRLAEAGFELTVWNRTRSKAEPLGERGARVADSAADAVRGADVVVTMLMDADAVADAVSDALPEFAEDALWVQTTTVGLHGWDQLASLAEEHGVAILDSPVLGTKAPAEQGKLTVLAAGPDELLERARPVLEVFGRVFEGLQRPGDGSRLKLVANTWVLGITDTAAQSIALARALGLDPQNFLRAIEGSPNDSQYAQMKAPMMIKGEFPASFSLAEAAKDARLIETAVREAGLDTALATAVATQFGNAAEEHGDEDLSAVIRAFTRGG